MGLTRRELGMAAGATTLAMAAKAGAQGATKRRMQVERQMGTVEGQIPIQRGFQFPVEDPLDRLCPAPEQSVVNQKKGARLSGCLKNNCLTRINGGNDPADYSLILDLQAVESSRIVADFSRPEQLIKSGN
jgi:hypothetical protein